MTEQQPERSFMARWGEGTRLIPEGRLHALINVVSLVLLTYTVWYALFGVTNRHFHASLFLVVTLPVVFLTTTRNKLTDGIGWSDWLLAFLAFLASLYYVLNDEFYRTLLVGMTEIPDYEIAVGLLMVALVTEACRRSVGWGLTGVIVALFAYVWFGQYLWGELGHSPIELDYFITIQTVTDEGLFGSSIDAAATYAILFITYGTFFQRTGGGQLFFELAAVVTRGARGGASKACVVSSGLYGSISGSPVADVVTTGPITIPLMHKTGVTPVRAAGLEAAASSGGSILPPVMGAVAFLMVEFTGIPYHEVAVASILPALLYYFGVLTCAHLEAMRHGEGIFEYDRVFSIWRVLADYWRHVASIVALIFLLASGLGAAYVGGFSLLVLLALCVLWKDPKRNIRLRDLLDGSGETVRNMAGLAIAVAGSGLIIGCITLSGLTGKFSIILAAVSGGQVIIVLVAAAILLILLGAGMPTASVYMMGVALIAPLLIQNYGVPVLQTHLFLVYYACLSAISPPVAVACFAAASIAGADPMKVGWYSSKAAFAGFSVPFFFIFNDGILLHGPLDVMAWHLFLGAIHVGALALALFWPFGDNRSDMVWRLGFGIASCAIIAPNMVLQGIMAAIIVVGGWIAWRLHARLLPAVGSAVSGKS